MPGLVRGSSLCRGLVVRLFPTGGQRRRLWRVQLLGGICSACARGEFFGFGSAALLGVYFYWAGTVGLLDEDSSIYLSSIGQSD